MKKGSVLFYLAIAAVIAISISSCTASSRIGCPMHRGMAGY
ncbi:MAG TPA: hypothetical protein VKT28_05740 [Puia sp.]|nr:hypothetical protein [Puia sp.]